ncbi:MAG: hypothetical protein FJX76_15785 [Armatimonadetes bacterium]|nr:hypothetical protein [Armatimonadota bacterium]
MSDHGIGVTPCPTTGNRGHRHPNATCHANPSLEAARRTSAEALRRSQTQFDAGPQADSALGKPERE